MISGHEQALEVPALAGLVLMSCSGCMYMSQVDMAKGDRLPHSKRLSFGGWGGSWSLYRLGYIYSSITLRQLMDIALSRPEALSLGYRLYYGNVCNHCGTNVKRVKKYDCLSCHKTKALEAVKRYFQTPTGRAKKRTSRRLDKANRKEARVPWADQKKITEIYQKAKELGYHVDHIIPLKHDLVCGLHCEFNLQVLPPEDNVAKRNHFTVG